MRSPKHHAADDSGRNYYEILMNLNEPNEIEQQPNTPEHAFLQEMKTAETDCWSDVDDDEVQVDFMAAMADTKPKATRTEDDVVVTSKFQAEYPRGKWYPQAETWCVVAKIPLLKSVTNEKYVVQASTTSTTSWPNSH